MKRKIFYIFISSAITLSLTAIISYCKKESAKSKPLTKISNIKPKSISSINEERHLVDEWIKKNLSPEAEWTNSKYINARILEARHKVNPSTTYWHNAEINNIKRLKNGLLAMTETEIGRTLLKLVQLNLARRHARINISVVSNGMSAFPLNDFPGPDFKPTDPLFIENIKKSGNGVGVVPSLLLDPSFRGDAFNDQDYNCSIFHELVHVYHCLIGESAWVQFSKHHSLKSVRPTVYEEARTVGLGRFRDEEISENKYREELKLPRRKEYDMGTTIVGDDDMITLDPNGPSEHRVPLPYPFAKKP